MTVEGSSPIDESTDPKNAALKDTSKYFAANVASDGTSIQEDQFHLTYTF